ncbi:unnamed protein product [Toxocara canis]|uniref:Low-density lipoprotein receptor domain class A n=1 Tax=Toxocara canis TaxID=6265 RepID=A0A183UKA2_TOXCA|nr:unnamed protein product [Toxocara canis]
MLSYLFGYSILALMSAAQEFQHPISEYLQGRAYNDEVVAFFYHAQDGFEQERMSLWAFIAFNFFNSINHFAVIAERCSENEFACCALPQKCIPIRRRCDGHPDCADGGDENNCPSCGIAQFACVKSGRCIAASKRCDGIPDDCADGSNLDEIGCSKNSTCIGKFVCDSDLSKSIMGEHNCIDYGLRCNGVRDCPNGEDEFSCDKSKREETIHTMCENQKESVTVRQWCDANVDCSDGSDEKFCS